MLELILISAFFAYGMFTAQRPGFIFHNWGLPQLFKKLPASLHEPLFACGVCVSSIWGGLCFLYVQSVAHFLHGFWAIIAFIPVVVVCATGITAFIDRGVKAFEKTYGYKPPMRDITKQWNYLMPYETLRAMIIQTFVMEYLMNGDKVIEIGGFTSHFAKIGRDNGTYFSYQEHTTPFKEMEQSWKDDRFCIVIQGLAFNGDLRKLKEAIYHSEMTIIEYSDDGISRQQIELLTEGFDTRMIIPDYEINVGDAPAQCGASASRRKIIMINNPYHGPVNSVGYGI